MLKLKQHLHPLSLLMLPGPEIIPNLHQFFHSLQSKTLKQKLLGLLSRCAANLEHVLSVSAHCIV